MLDIAVSSFVLATPKPDATHFARRLLGSATLEIGGMLVIRGVKLIRLDDGRLIVGFPDRPEWVKCEWCNKKTPAEGHHCCMCGTWRPVDDPDERLRRNDVHPVTHEGRALVERLVVAAWERAVGEREAVEVGSDANGSPATHAQGHCDELLHRQGRPSDQGVRGGPCPLADRDTGMAGR